MVSRQIMKITNSSNSVLLNNLQIHINAKMPPKMHRNQRTSRVTTNFIRSQIKVSHKTLQYINFQNFNPHAFRAEFICFHCFFSREDTSIHTFCEKTPVILTLIYFCIIFQSNYILIYVIIFLYYINS